MILSQIAAMAKNRVIGVNNALPWNIPEDFKFFKDKTKGHILIMGRKTFDSLGRTLPNRLHVVVSRTPQKSADPQVIYVTSFTAALAAIKPLQGQWPEEVFIIGGAEIYRQTLKDADRIYLTVIEKDFDGDAYFPEFSLDDFKLTHKEDRTQPIPFSFRTYDRIH